VERSDGRYVVSGGLLDGLRVIDLSLWQPGHTATQLLADLGADVVKVEPPGGDRMRPMADRFANFNGHKTSVTLNLKLPQDRERLMAMVADAEVVVENYRPGVGARLGIGFEQLREANPSIVMCSISGFGQTGPLSDQSGHDPNYQAYAGAMTVSAPGAEPQQSGLLIGDQGSGMASAFAILAAVVCARRTGEPEHIDVSMTDVLASWVAPMGPIDPRRTIEHKFASPAMGVFRTADSTYVVLGIFSEDHFWDLLCGELGLGGQIGLSMAERTENAEELRMVVAESVARRTSTDLLAALMPLMVPIAPVLSRQEMLDHPHFREREVFVTDDDGYLALGHPIRYAEHPARPPGPAPSLPERAD
jgi:crotonobetainyl-CoA:carnitine CoA-transferase CaiB-like acyl-CoA transferase